MVVLKLKAKTTFNMYRSGFLLSLTGAGHGEVFPPSNPFKVREILKGQCDLTIHERSQPQEKLDGLYKDMDIHGVLSKLASMVSSLKKSLVEKDRALVEKNKAFGEVWTSLSNSETSK